MMEILIIGIVSVLLVLFGAWCGKTAKRQLRKEEARQYSQNEANCEPTQ